MATPAAGRRTSTPRSASTTSSTSCRPTWSTSASTSRGCPRRRPTRSGSTRARRSSRAAATPSSARSASTWSSPGRMALITGSSHVLTGQSAEQVTGEGFFGAFTDAVVPGPVHGRGRPGLHRLGHEVVQGVLRDGSADRSRAARGRGLRGAQRADRGHPAGLRRADRARLLAGQPHALHRPARARDDVGLHPRPLAGARLQGDPGGHRLRHRAHPALHVATRASTSRSSWPPAASPRAAS